MRITGALLIFLGIIAALVGTFSGCGALFSWNGRHAIETRTLGEGHGSEELIPEAGRRYTLAIQLEFDREGLEKKDASIQLEAKLPLVVRVTDRAKTKLAEVVGWIDPSEPPNVLYGQTVRADSEPLVVERIVGPFGAASKDPLTIEVELGADRVNKATITQRRLVIYDDTLPPKIKNAFVLGGGGIVLLIAGLVVSLRGWLWRPRKRRAVV